MAEYMDKELKRFGITISKPILAITCIVFGILVIVFPNLLVWIVGLFLMVQGILLLTDTLEQKRPAKTATASQSLYCSQCGTRNTEEAAYCEKCGKSLNNLTGNHSGT